MKNLIELNNADLNMASFKDVMFLSFAEGGAMGDAGAIVFYVKSGEGYYLNYVYGDVDITKVMALFPVLERCKFGICGIGSEVPEGWKYVDLGVGNHLLVKNEVYDSFRSHIGENYYPPVVYREWSKIADRILNTDKYSNC